jgi:hypothetical protein
MQDRLALRRWPAQAMHVTLREEFMKSHRFVVFASWWLVGCTESTGSLGPDEAEDSVGAVGTHDATNSTDSAANVLGADSGLEAYRLFIPIEGIKGRPRYGLGWPVYSAIANSRWHLSMAHDGVMACGSEQRGSSPKWSALPSFPTVSTAPILSVRGFS